ncbi:MAG: DUF4190 domain-containing protein [Planctomycetales bacterium]|nr:DUF4190 domain-containing protein [Planctomycetales bacterium]
MAFDPAGTVLSLLLLALLLAAAIGAVVTGVSARRSIARNADELRGGGLAVAGIVLGSLGLLLCVGGSALVLLLAMREARIARAEEETAALAAPVPAVPAPAAPGTPRRTR